MNSSRNVRKLNSLLSQELGSPPYSWQWSDSLLHPMRAIRDDGSLLFNYRCGCGLNRSIHLPTCASLTVAEPVYILRPVLPLVSARWVLCKLVPNPPEYVWRRQFGSMLDYQPFNWVPCSPVYLEPGEEPDSGVTWEVVYAVRRDRQKHILDVRNAAEDRDRRREKAQRDRLYGMIAEDVSMPFGGIPGTKGAYSFGGVGPGLIPTNNDNTSQGEN